MEDKISITLCMILRDEGATISQVLESARWVDRVICGIDSRSSDDTERICKEFGAETYAFDFNDSFAGSRNRGFEMVDTEWILQLDGHEVLQVVKDGNMVTPTREDWLALTKLAADRFDCINMQLWNNLEPSGLPGIIFPAPRIFRSRFKMKGNIHNFIDGVECNRSVFYPYLVLLHQRPQAVEARRHEQRMEINVKRLLEDVEADPKDPRPLFYLGQTYIEHGDWKQAEHYYKLHQKLSKFESELYQGALQLARLRLQAKDFKQVIKWLVKCEGHQMTRNDHLVLWGEAYLAWFEALLPGVQDFSKLEMAKTYLERAALSCVDRLADLPLNIPATSHFIEGKNLTYYPHQLLMVVNDYLKNYPEALRHCEQHCNLMPNDMGAQKNRALLRALVRPKGEKRIVVFDQMGQFMGQLTDDWKKRHIVDTYQTYTPKQVETADVIWLEWCDENAIQGAARNHPGKHVVCRIHRYELFNGMVGNVNWSNVDTVFVVSEWMKELFEGQLRTTRPGRVIVLPNGIDLDKFSFRDHGPGNKIGYLGYLNWKKGVDVMLMLAKELPEFDFHVGGTWQIEEYKALSNYYRLPNVIYHGWVESNPFLEYMDYFLGASMVESQHLSMFEAMAKGIKPLCRDWPGSREWLPDDLIWTTTDDVKRMLSAGARYDSSRYREIVMEKADLKTQLKTVNEVLDL